MQQFVSLFLAETTILTLTLHVEETLESWEPPIDFINDELQIAQLLLVQIIDSVEFPYAKISI